MSRQSRSKAQARSKAKRSGPRQRALAEDPEITDALRAEAHAVDAEIRALVARQREREVPVRAELDQMLAAAAEVEQKLEALGQASALSLSPDGQETARALFRHLVGGAWILREFSAFDTGPEERAIVDDLVRQLDEEQEEARASEAAEHARPRG